MLRFLHIENIALIKELNIDLKEGFSAFTGQTGAGKSILIDSLALLCGARADRGVIRSGCDFALVEGAFDCPPSLFGLLEEEGIDYSNGELFIRRTLTADGKSVCKINSRQIPVALHREIANNLIAIHGQNDTSSLKHEAEQLNLLDLYAKNSDLLASYQAAHTEYKAAAAELDELIRIDLNTAAINDALEIKIAELSGANVLCGEEQQLNEERNRLMHAEKINENASAAYNKLNETAGAVDLISQSAKHLSELEKIIPQASELESRLHSCRYELEDIAETLSRILTDADDFFDIDKIESRLSVIGGLKKRYFCQADELPEKLTVLITEKNEIDNNGEKIKALKMDLENKKALLDTVARLLTESRKTASIRFCEAVKIELSELEMSKCAVKIEFEQIDYTKNGNDRIEFLISPNAGEIPRPVGKIASGGELSRIMLAIKSVIAADADKTLIFDEIDAGISGKISHLIGLKLKKLSESGSQLLCVTHSAQLCAVSPNHYLIEKKEADGRVTTEVLYLDHEGRIEELSRIMSGNSVTDNIKLVCRELLSSCGNYN